MKKMKRYLALALASLMAMSILAACGGNTSSSEAPKTEEPAASETGTEPTPEEPSAEAGMASWTAFEETVKIRVPVYDRANDGLPPVDDNYWTKWVQSEFGDTWNVEVEYVAIPRTDVMTTYNLLIAAGNTPTIMMEYDYPKVAEWASDGAMQVIDLAEFAEVAPTYYGKMVENDQLGYTDINGDTYFVLSERPYYNTGYTHYTWVRMDWLREVGYDDVPKTYQEHVDAMQKIMDAGLCDYPLGLGVPSDAYARNFAFRSNDIDEAEWAMHSSLGTSGLSWEPTKLMIQRLNEEFNMGFYSKEFDSMVNSSGGASDDLQTGFINGQLYQYGAYASAKMDWLEAFYENNPDAEIALASNWAAVDGEIVTNPISRADNPFGMIVGFSSYASEDELKAAWMLMEWMIQEENLFTLENGIEGLTFEYGDDGLPVMIADYDGDERMNYNSNIDMTCLVRASKVNGTIEQSIAAMAPQGLPQDFTQMMIDLWNNETKVIADNGWAYTDPIFAVEIPEESEYSSALLSTYQEAFVDLVKCDPADFDAKYDEWSAKYLSQGYQEIIDARLAAYEAGNTTKLPWNF